MNSEPIYSYVAGQGWVPTLGYIFIMECGTRVRLEHRPPQDGEPFSYVYIGDGDGWAVNNIPVMPKFADAYRGDRYENLGAWSGYNASDIKNRIWVTFVRLTD